MEHLPHGRLQTLAALQMRYKIHQFGIRRIPTYTQYTPGANASLTITSPYFMKEKVTETKY